LFPKLICFSLIPKRKFHCVNPFIGEKREREERKREKEIGEKREREKKRSERREKERKRKFNCVNPFIGKTFANWAEPGSRRKR